MTVINALMYLSILSNVDHASHLVAVSRTRATRSDQNQQYCDVFPLESHCPIHPSAVLRLPCGLRLDSSRDVSIELKTVIFGRASNESLCPPRDLPKTNEKVCENHLSDNP